MQFGRREAGKSTPASAKSTCVISVVPEVVPLCTVAMSVHVPEDEGLVLCEALQVSEQEAELPWWQVVQAHVPGCALPLPTAAEVRGPRGIENDPNAKMTFGHLVRALGAQGLLTVDVVITAVAGEQVRAQRARANIARFGRGGIPSPQPVGAPLADMVCAAGMDGETLEEEALDYEEEDEAEDYEDEDALMGAPANTVPVVDVGEAGGAAGEAPADGLEAVWGWKSWWADVLPFETSPGEYEDCDVVLSADSAVQLCMRCNDGSCRLKEQPAVTHISKGVWRRLERDGGCPRFAVDGACVGGDQCELGWHNALSMWGSSRADWSLMTAVKRQFDPEGLLSPGRGIEAALQQLALGGVDQ